MREVGCEKARRLGCDREDARKLGGPEARMRES